MKQMTFIVMAGRPDHLARAGKMVPGHPHRPIAITLRVRAR
jgi:hypothetical protein